MKKIAISALALLAALLLGGCQPGSTTEPTTSEEPSEAAAENADAALHVVAELEKGPGNLTVTPDGQVLVSLHQFFGHETRVARVLEDGQLEPFAADAGLDSVLGLQADASGTVWLLDNAMRGGGTRRLVGWHATDDRLVADIDLTGASAEDSFLNDLAVDPDRGAVYIADPAGGANAAILVVDLTAGTARRVLEGHESVTPEDLDLIIDESPVRMLTEDGTEIRPRIGVNPIAIDQTGEWLYFGPMHATSLYRVATADLRDTGLTAEQLAERVERFADKPICDGISIDHDGNIYLGDLAANAIGVIGPDRQYRTLVADERLSWVDAFSFGPDGHLYTVVNQLHRTAALNGGQEATEPPYLVLKLEPLAAGTSGR